MNKTSLLLLVTAFCVSALAHADIYKYVDEDGHVTYSNVPIKGAKRISVDPPVTSGERAPSKARRARAETPAGFPKVDPQTQNQRDDKRRHILLEELENEKKALEEAKKAYAEGEATPEVYRTKDGRTFRNVAKYEEKMQRLQASVDAHEKNIQLLQKELDALN